MIELQIWVCEENIKLFLIQIENPENQGRRYVFEELLTQERETLRRLVRVRGSARFAEFCAAQEEDAENATKIPGENGQAQEALGCVRGGSRQQQNQDSDWPLADGPGGQDMFTGGVVRGKHPSWKVTGSEGL